MVIIGTFGGGITIKELDKWSSLSSEDGMTSEDINPNSFCVIDGKLYMGVGGRGVDIFDGESFSNLNWQHGLCSENIFCIKQHNGKIYFGTENGLYIKW